MMSQLVLPLTSSLLPYVIMGTPDGRQKRYMNVRKLLSSIPW